MTHTSTEQPEALRLANWLDTGGWPSYVPQESAAELRRLHARVQELEASQAQRVPMSDEFHKTAKECGQLWYPTRKNEPAGYLFTDSEFNEFIARITQEKQG